MTGIIRYIAGHHFDDSDRCVLDKTIDGVTFICGRKWVDIKDVDEGCVGQNGYAHISYLNAAEYAEIVRERERRQRAYEQATRGVSGGGDYAEAAPGALTCWQHTKGDATVRPAHRNLVTVNVTLRPAPPEPELSVEDVKRGVLAHFRDIYGSEPDALMLALSDAMAVSICDLWKANLFFVGMFDPPDVP